MLHKEKEGWLAMFSSSLGFAYTLVNLFSQTDVKIIWLRVFINLSNMHLVPRIRRNAQNTITKVKNRPSCLRTANCKNYVCAKNGDAVKPRSSWIWRECFLFTVFSFNSKMFSVKLFWLKIALLLWDSFWVPHPCLCNIFHATWVTLIHIISHL